MTDSELLMSAAKAASITHVDGKHLEISFFSWSPQTIQGIHLGNAIYWNPLSDDGDALRLAVKLGFYLEIDRPNARASALPEPDNMKFSRERFGNDPCAVFRRSIVRAAAEIGSAMS